MLPLLRQIILQVTCSFPTTDHYLPLLYVVASRQKGETVSFPVEGVDGGSISMFSVKIG